MKHAVFRRDLEESQERKRLHDRIARLVDKWSPILGVHVQHWDLRKMKKYWGSANRSIGHTTFNTDIGKLAPKYVEYLVVHELAHHRTDGHDPTFFKLMDQNLPGWRKLQAQIEEPLTRYS